MPKLRTLEVVWPWGGEGFPIEDCDLCNPRAICILPYQNATAEDILCRCVEGFVMGDPQVPSAKDSCSFTNPVIHGFWIANFALAWLNLAYVIISESYHLWMVKRVIGHSPTMKKFLSVIFFNTFHLYTVFVQTWLKIQNYDAYFGTDFFQTWCLSSQLGITFSYAIFAVHRMCKYLALKQENFRKDAELIKGTVLGLRSKILFAKVGLTKKLILIIVVLHQVPAFLTLLEHPGRAPILFMSMIWVLLVPVYIVQLFVSTSPTLADFTYMINFPNEERNDTIDALAKRARKSRQNFLQQRNTLFTAYSITCVNLFFLLWPGSKDKFEYVFAVSIQPTAMFSAIFFLRSRQQVSFRKLKTRLKPNSSRGNNSNLIKVKPVTSNETTETTDLTAKSKDTED